MLTSTSQTDAVRQRFSVRGAAQKWNAMYAGTTAKLDEYNFRQRRDITVDYVLRVVQPGARVLDLGCGAAPVLSALRQHGVVCMGLDYAPDMLDYARDRLQARGLETSNLLLGDCRRLPFRTASFDVVVCLGVISYVEEKEHVLQEIRRILKPGGTVIISCRNRFNPVLSDPIAFSKHVGKILLRRTAPAPFSIGQGLDPRAVTARMVAHGFRFVQFRGIGFGPFCLWKRPLFGDQTSIAISQTLTRVFATSHMHGAFRWLTDVSLWVYQRPAHD
jgi:ubiquinone/menaquinone biosynthesis C-methylase UbiE